MKLYRQKALFLAAILAPLWIAGSTPQASAAVDNLTDFNGDGYADLAIGVPREDVNGMADAGIVQIIYGSSSGLSATFVPDQRFFQDYSVAGDPSSNIRDVSEADDHFGSSLATGDFNGDGYSDLAVGVPDEDLGLVPNAGAVNVIYGSASGLSPSAAILNQIFTQDSPSVEDAAEGGDQFGSELASGDFNNDGYWDLAAGVSREDINGQADAGSVNILYGSSSGLSATAIADQRFFQDSPNMADFSENGDLFGIALAAGDYNSDSYADLAIGASSEDLATANAGAVSIIYGSSAGLSAVTAIADQLFSQSTTDLGDGFDSCHTNFGSKLASGDFNGDGNDDLAIGSPSDGCQLGPPPTSGNPQGALNVIYGSSAGLSVSVTRDDQYLNGDWFETYGDRLATGDFDGDGYDELVVGESVEVFSQGMAGGPGSAGHVEIYRGSSSGLPADASDVLVASETWSQDSPDVEGDSELGDHFGIAVATGDFNNDGFSDLAVGSEEDSVSEVSPDEAGPSEGAVNAIYGSASGLSATDVSDQLWTQDSPGIDDAGENGDRFGARLASG